MKYALALSLTVFGAVANAQPIHRCEYSPGHVVYQDKLCMEPSAIDNAAQTQMSEPVTTHLSLDKPSFTSPEDGHSSWSRQQRKKHLQTMVKTRTETLHQLPQPLNDLKTAEYADNHRRCEKAMRVAAICGKFSGGFSCDEKGFRHEPITEDIAIKSAAMDNGNVFMIEQCALRAANGGF